MRTTVRQLSATVLAVLTLAVVDVSPAFAQIGGQQPAQERHEGIGIGIKGGWLFPEFSQEGIEFDNRSGYQVGLFFGGNRPGLVGVMAEVNYGQKGTEHPVFGDYDVKFVSVPVVLRVNVGSQDLSGISVYGIAGPQLDWLISQESELLPDIDDDTEGFEVSAVVGGGIEITRFIVELRYIHGLRSISRTFDLSETTDLKTKSFAILFGIRFN